jgi:hypothetical protein
VVDEALVELAELRPKLADPAVLRRRAMEEACFDGSKEAQLQHRYEMAHDRCLRATLKELVALAKSGADLAEEAKGEAEAGEGGSPQVLTDQPVGVRTPDAPSEPERDPERCLGKEVAPERRSVGSAAEPEGQGPDAPGIPVARAGRDRDGRTWPVEGGREPGRAAPIGL